MWASFIFVRRHAGIFEPLGIGPQGFQRVVGENYWGEKIQSKVFSSFSRSESVNFVAARLTSKSLRLEFRIAEMCHI